MSDNPYGSRGINTSPLVTVAPPAAVTMPTGSGVTGVNSDIYRNVWTVPQGNPMGAASSTLDVLKGVQQYRSGQISLAQQQQAAINAYMTPLVQRIQRGEQLSPSDVTKQLGLAVAAGIPGADQAVKNFQNSPLPINDYVMSQVTAASNMSPAERIQMQQPQYGTASAGNQIVPFTTPGGLTSGPRSVTFGNQSAGQSLPLTLTPDQAAQPYNYTDATTGQPVNTTLGAYAAKFGQLPPGYTGGVGGAIPPGSGGAAAANPPAGTGQQPAVASTSSTAPTGGERRAPQPQARIDASEQAWNTARTFDASYAQRSFPLVQADEILRTNPDMTGPGAEGFNNLKAVIATWLPGQAADIAKVADFQGLNKYLQQGVMNNPFSGRSDQALAETLSGSPNVHLVGLANQNLVKAAIGLQRMEHAAVVAFRNSGAPYGGWQDFIDRWQTGVDPRAFIADRLDTKQQQTLVSSLKTASQRRTFSNTLDIIENNPEITGSPVMPH